MHQASPDSQQKSIVIDSQCTQILKFTERLFIIL
jgi:hypothetical protein